MIMINLSTILLQKFIFEGIAVDFVPGLKSLKEAFWLSSESVASHCCGTYCVWRYSNWFVSFLKLKKKLMQKRCCLNTGVSKEILLLIFSHLLLCWLFWLNHKTQRMWRDLRNDSIACTLLMCNWLAPKDQIWVL